MATDERAKERTRHLCLIENRNPITPSEGEGRLHEIRSTPLFTSKVRHELEDGNITGIPKMAPFPNYGFLGIRTSTFGRDAERHVAAATAPIKDEDMVYANTNAPWSAFICGSQGGGKSHTMSCMLENCLLSPSAAVVLQNPCAAIVFHYDTFSSNSAQLCEAAYLCSAGIPVRVLVSPSNLANMRKVYENLPGLAQDVSRPQVSPLLFEESQLDVTNMMTLMAVNDGGNVPLYIEVLYRILRDMAVERGEGSGIDYNEFKGRLEEEAFSGMQNGPLKMRLDLLESFLYLPGKYKHRKARPDLWSFHPGTLTIIDLSCPFVAEDAACALFTVCLGRFLDGRKDGPRLVALDEAHKFLKQSGEAVKFTERLTSIIAQQRHLATRVIISTQEPTLSPQLLQLCNVTIVHRFLSPAWFEILKSHLAGVRGNGSTNSHDIFNTIVNLRVGEALVFSPTSFLDVVETRSDPIFFVRVLQALGTAYIKIGIRKRTTADGGQSMMASSSVEAANDSRTQNTKTLPAFGGDNTYQSSKDSIQSKNAGKKEGPNDAALSLSLKQVSPQIAPEAAKPRFTSESSSSSDVGGTISADARRCLINATTLHMKRNSDYIGCNEVRETAEKDLGWTRSTFTKFDDSGMIIKHEVVSIVPKVARLLSQSFTQDEYCKADNLRRPKNATWKEVEARR